MWTLVGGMLALGFGLLMAISIYLGNAKGSLLLMSVIASGILLGGTLLCLDYFGIKFLVGTSQRQMKFWISGGISLLAVVLYFSGLMYLAFITIGVAAVFFVKN